MPQTIVYRFRVELRQPLTDDPDHPDFYTAAQATSAERQRAIEKAVYNAVRIFEGDADCELTEYEITEDA